MKARPKELSHYSTVNIKKYNLKLIYKHNRTALFNIHKCNVLEKKTIINTLWQWGCDWALAEDAGKPWLFSPVSEISLSSTNSWNKLARVSGICKRNVCGWSCRSKAWCGIYWGGDWHQLHVRALPLHPLQQFSSGISPQGSCMRRLWGMALTKWE